MQLKSDPLILVINPGSTTTKTALFSGMKKISEEGLAHSKDELARFSHLWDQYHYRMQTILGFLKKQNIQAFSLQAVVGRGGMLKPLRRGTYQVDQAMIKDAKNGVQGEHVSNLGCALAYDVAKLYASQAFVVDPVSVDEFEPLARYSGHPLISRRSLSHALNLRAAAIWAADKLQLQADLANFVVAHLGGGISVAPVKGGRIIDVNDASSDGPFSPQRTGGLPLQPFIQLVFSGHYTESEVKQMIMGKGGLVAYLETQNIMEIEARISRGDGQAEEVFLAMIYQIAKEIGAMATVLKGDVNAIVLTGGLANSDYLVRLLTEYVRFIAPVLSLPGELEMEALAAGAVRVLTGRENALKY